MLEPPIDEGLILTEERVKLENDFLKLKAALIATNPLSVAGRAIEKLHEIARAPLHENLFYLPWELLLLIKWSFAYKAEGGRPEKLSEGQFRSLVETLKAVTEYGLPVVEGSVGLKNLRVIAHQQFWLQEGPTVSSIGRSIILFCRLPCQFPIKAEFKETTGLELEHFFELVFALASHWYGDNPSLAIERGYFGPIEKHYPAGTIDRFLELISLSLSDAVDFARKDFARSPITRQVFEQSPFIRYPLLQVHEKYLAYSPVLIFEMQRTFPITLLASLFGKRFWDAMGRTFELYLEKGLEFARLRHFSEKDIIAALGGESAKVVDFIVPLSGCTILIEAKAKRLPPHVATKPTNPKLIKALRSTVIHAYQKFYEMTRLIRKGALGQLGIAETGKVICLLVTYDELYALNGQVLWQEFAAEALKPWLAQKQIQEGEIDQERVLFLDVEGFDSLMSIAGDPSTDLCRLVDEVVVANKDPKSVRLTFEEHLMHRTPAPSALPYLASVVEETNRSLLMKMPEAEGSSEKLAELEKLLMEKREAAKREGKKN